MITLTRLDRQPITLNSDLIASIEARPDATLHLITGQSLVVRETVAEVVERIRDWRASVLERAGLAGLLVAPAQLPRTLPGTDEEELAA
jgi:flagellar protein FlbD